MACGSIPLAGPKLAAALNLLGQPAGMPVDLTPVLKGTDRNVSMYVECNADKNPIGVKLTAFVDTKDQFITPAVFDDAGNVIEDEKTGSAHNAQNGQIAQIVNLVIDPELKLISYKSSFECKAPTGTASVCDKYLSEVEGISIDLSGTHAEWLEPFAPEAAQYVFVTETEYAAKKAATPPPAPPPPASTVSPAVPAAPAPTGTAPALPPAAPKPGETPDEGPSTVSKITSAVGSFLGNYGDWILGLGGLALGGLALSRTRKQNKELVALRKVVHNIKSAGAQQPQLPAGAPHAVSQPPTTGSSNNNAVVINLTTIGRGLEDFFGAAVLAKYPNLTQTWAAYILRKTSDPQAPTGYDTNKAVILTDLFDIAEQGNITIAPADEDTLTRQGVIDTVSLRELLKI